MYFSMAVQYHGVQKTNTDYKFSDTNKAIRTSQATSERNESMWTLFTHSMLVSFISFGCSASRAQFSLFISDLVLRSLTLVKASPSIWKKIYVSTPKITTTAADWFDNKFCGDKNFQISRCLWLKSYQKFIKSIWFANVTSKDYRWIFYSPNRQVDLWHQKSQPGSGRVYHYAVCSSSTGKSEYCE